MIYAGRNQDRQEFKVVGRRDIPARLSYAIATGAAKYSRDIVLPNMLHGKVLRSPYCRARIKSMDTSRAEALRGVKAVITWEDEEIKAMDRTPFFGTGITLGNKADREGDEVGVVIAAESEELCNQALKLIDIEWEVLPHVLDPREALKPGAPILQPELNPDTNVFQEENWEDGDVEAGFRKADHIIEYDMLLPLRNQFWSKPCTAVAWWEQDHMGTEGKTLFIECDGNYTQEDMMAAFNLPEDKVHFLSPYIGGHYCDWRRFTTPRLASLVAKRTGRPVRIAYTRRDNFDFGSAQAYSHLKIGFNDDGVMTAAHGQIVNGEGTTGTNARTVNMHSFRSTKCPNIKNEGKLVWTSTARVVGDFGTYYDYQPLSMAIWRIADELGMDPTEVVLKNCHTPEPSLKLVIEKGKAAIGWQWHAPGTKKLPNGKMHGLGFRYHDNTPVAQATYHVSIVIKPDGKVYMPYREGHFGTFWEEACAMVIAEELGARIEDVIPQFVPNMPTWLRGAATDRGAGGTWVAKEAALDLKEKLLQTAAATLKVAPEELDTKDSTVYLKADPSKSYSFGDFAVGNNPLATSYTGKYPHVEGSTGGAYRSLKTLTTMNAVFCEVEVDTETGEVEITKMVGVADAGKAIRPSSFESQIEDHLIATIGQAKAEEMIYDKATGVLLNGNALEYKLPTIFDALPIESITVETRLGTGCYGATTNSHHIMNREVVNCAVQNAIGKWIDVPITPDKVLKALGKI